MVLDRLTFMRFPAALAVVFFHFKKQLLPGLAGTSFVQAAFNGPVAVSFFYTLSGFIMAYVYAGLDRSGAKAYWVARLARIYPVYLLALCLSLGVVRWNVEDLGLSLAMIQAFVPGHVLAINAPGWSLSVEMFFYALFPFVMPIVRAAGAMRFLWLSIGLWAMTQVWTTYLLTYRYDGYPSASHDLLFYFPPHHLATFLLGVAAGTMVRAGALSATSRQGFGLVVLSVAAYWGVVVFLPSFFASMGVMLPLATGLLAPVFAILCIGLFHLPSRWRTSPAAIFAGEASYAVYLLQVPVFVFLPSRLQWYFGLSVPSAAWATLVVLLVVSACVFRFVETPARRLVRSLAGIQKLPASHVA